MNPAPKASATLLGLDQVAALVRLERWQVAAGVESGDFPAPTNGKWARETILAWIIGRSTSEW